MRKAEKSLRPQRLSGEKGLPQRRRDAEGMAPAAYFAKAAKARERGPTEVPSFRGRIDGGRVVDRLRA